MIGMTLLLLACAFTFIVYRLVPWLVQVAIDYLGRNEQPRPPVVHLVKLQHFGSQSLSISVDVLLPLPTAVSLPTWLSAGISNTPTITVHWNSMKPSHLISASLSKSISLSGEFDAIQVQQDIDIQFVDIQALERLSRKLFLQLKARNSPINAIDIKLEALVDIHMMGIVLWKDVKLVKLLDIAPMLETLRNDPIFTESHKNPSSLIPPPVFFPDHLDLESMHSSNSSEDIDKTATNSTPGPLHLYKIGYKTEKTNVDQQVSRVGFQGLLPGLTFRRLPQTTTPQGSVKTGIRASFSATPALQFRIHHIEFNVKLNGEFVAHGMVGEVFLGTTSDRKRWTDISVEITPTIIKEGRSDVVKNAISGAKGFLKGFFAGTMSGFNGGDFGDGSTVFEIVDVNVYAFTERENVINVDWIRDVSKAVDMSIDVNPIKAIGNKLDTSIIVEVAASFMLAHACSVM
ncbi:hypothetical protein BDR26DRAFT_863359 [Obelidium mucronatum]|nr:hypothetical protein BDR26DRAFT_863359 [Obelidium mucronatum]